MPGDDLHQHTRPAGGHFAQRMVNSNGEAAKPFRRLLGEAMENLLRERPIRLIGQPNERSVFRVHFRSRPAEKHALSTGGLRKWIEPLRSDRVIEQSNIDQR